MKKLWIQVLKKWEYKREQKRQVATFLKTYNLKLLKRRETSIILGCFSPIASSTKKGKFDLADADGNILDTNLSELEVSKRMEAYTKAAKKEGISVEEYLKKLVRKNNIKFDGQSWFWKNAKGLELRWAKLSEKQILNNINTKITKAIKPGHIFEGQVGKRIFELGKKFGDEVTDFSNVVFSKNNKGKFKQRNGDIDCATNKYIFEAKSNLSAEKEIIKLAKQIEKYIPANSNTSSKFMNALDKKVVIIYKKGLINNSSSTVKELQSKGVIFIDGIENLKKLY